VNLNWAAERREYLCFVLSLNKPGQNRDRITVTFHCQHTLIPSSVYHGYTLQMPDDGRMTETCCGNNIRRAGEELLR
jgi:hypothetical protein